MCEITWCIKYFIILFFVLYTARYKRSCNGVSSILYNLHAFKTRLYNLVDVLYSYSIVRYCTVLRKNFKCFCLHSMQWYHIDNRSRMQVNIIFLSIVTSQSERASCVVIELLACCISSSSRTLITVTADTLCERNLAAAGVVDVDQAVTINISLCYLPYRLLC